MPATLRSLTAKVVDLAIPIDDDPAGITIQYRPHNMTANTEARIHTASGENLELAALVEMTLPVLASWDFRMDEGEDVIPLTKEGLSEVPGTILLLVLEAIAEDRRPDSKGTA